ncbi:UNVERIFIED_CONTAM: hypothetical protein GTU68_056874, partial [Idotea baltica]|nr:hypothetical protein [Idotea baltica]
SDDEIEEKQVFEKGIGQEKTKRKHSDDEIEEMRVSEKRIGQEKTAKRKHSDDEIEEKQVSENDKHSDDEIQKKQMIEKGIGKVVASHYNQLEEKGLLERNLSRIVYMRNFNNWMKSILLMKYLEQIREQSTDEHRIIAMDMGCGKGGDLLKWQKGNIRHLICVDIASTSISQCQERYELFRQKGRIFETEFIVADCTKTRLKHHIKYPQTKVDLVSCQFSFHYSFESLSQAETMLQNASDLLRKGGYFVATIPNANKIVSSLAASEGSSFGNEVFKIEFPEDRPADPPLFGDAYNFFLEGVVNCPEFLVHFPTLVRLAEKYGLELVYKKSFEDLYKEGINDRESRSLMFRMKALE